MKSKTKLGPRFDFNVEDLGNASAFFSEVDLVAREISGGASADAGRREDGFDEEEADLTEIFQRHAS